MKIRLIIPFLAAIGLNEMVHAQDHSNVSYGPEARQFLHIYIAPSNSPTPVYFDAHFNGGNINMPPNIVNSLTTNEISIVSWESLTTVSTQSDVQTGWDDAELMFAWVKANADTYNFDTTNFIIGGSSRGTILSWKYGHRADTSIRGLYMYNALPNSVWNDSTWWYPPNEVSTSSPPVFFVYLREPGCSADPVNPDIHDPNNGFTIMNRYNDLGIGNHDTLIHSLNDSASSDRYQYLLDFALSVINRPVGIQSNTKRSSSLQAYPNPFTDYIQLRGLSGKERLILRNIMGQVIKEGRKEDLLNLGNLDSGIYLLTIQSESSEKTLKLVKK